MTSATTRSTGRLAPALLLGALALTACSDEGSSAQATSDGSAASGAKASASGKSGASGAAPSTDAPEGTIQTVPDMGKQVAGIRKDVKIESCGLKTGEQVGKGTVKNTNKAARDLLVAVQWLPNDSGDPLAIGVWKAKKVEPGKTVNWSAKGTLKAAAGRCVLLAQSAPPGTIK